MSEFNGLPEEGEGKDNGLKHLRKIAGQTQAKWKALGFFDGLKGHAKQNIAELYECQASQLLKDPKAFPLAMRVVKQMNGDLENKNKAKD